MDTTLSKSDEELVCRCCCKNFSDDQLHSLFEYTNEEMELYKILILFAPVVICRNDGYSQKICLDCKSQALNAYRFRQMCISTDENIRCNRKPFMTNNEHDYSTWNIHNDDYDMDLSEYLIDTKEPDHQESLLTYTEITQTPAVDETINFHAPSPSKKSRRYSCPVCSKLWPTPSKLKRHLSVHKIEKEFSKTEPSKPPPKVFLPLLYEEPKKEPEAQCPICFETIESQTKLLLHMTVHIKNEIRAELRMEQANENILIAHKIGKRRYVCTTCGSESSSPAKLQAHMKTHMKKSQPVTATKGSENRFTKVFESSKRSSVNSRPKPSHRRKGLRRHACLLCEKRFETPSKLQRHQSVHQDVSILLKNDVIENPSILEISAVTSILGD